MRQRRSFLTFTLALLFCLSLAACGSADSAASSAAPAGDFDTDQDITVISREDGSGTRGAFIELTGVEEKNADGKKVDNTTEAAAIQSSTNGVMTAVANDETPSDEPLYKRAPVNFALNFPFVKFKIDDFLKNGIATIKKDAVNDSPVAIGAPMIPKFKTLIKT